MPCTSCNENISPLHNCNPCADCPPPNVVNLPPCVSGEPCEDLMGAECVSYTGPNLPALGVSNQARFLSVLLSLHKVINDLRDTPIPVIAYTATNTGTAPYVITYLGLGPVYTSTPGATGASTTITVGSTTGLVAGMTVQVTSGVGAFPANTLVTAVTSTTQFTVSAAPSTALTGGASVITATGSDHQMYTISVVAGTPKSFSAFAGSTVVLSGTGTIV